MGDPPYPERIESMRTLRGHEPGQKGKGTSISGPAGLRPSVQCLDCSLICEPKTLVKREGDKTYLSCILWIVEGPTQHKQFKLETYYMDAPVNGVMSPTGRTGSSRSACPCRGSAVDPFARSRLISTRWRVWISHPPVSTPERPEPLNGGRRLPATRENTVRKTRSWQLMNVRDCALRAARQRSP